MTMTPPSSTRRQILFAAFALPWVCGCSTPLPLVAAPTADADAARRLRESAEAHGLAAYRQLDDINVATRAVAAACRPDPARGRRRGLSRQLAGATDAQGRHRRAGLHRTEGPQAGGLGRHGRPDAPGTVAVWFNGVGSDDAAAQSARRSSPRATACSCSARCGSPIADCGCAPANEKVDGRLCDVVDVWFAPGLGRSAVDRVALCIDRSENLVRRMRFTLEGFANTQGAVAEVDTFEHERRFGVVWPMRSFERIVHPIALPAHDWRITGLDVDRGYGVDDIVRGSFEGAAAAPAAPV